MQRGMLMLGLAAVLVAWLPPPGAPTVVLGQAAPAQAVTIASAGSADLRDWDNAINQMLRADELQVRLERADTLIPGRTVQQLDQYYLGVPIWGAGVSRQLDGPVAVSVFGVLYQDPIVDVKPKLTEADAASIAEQRSGPDAAPARQPRLTILAEEGQFRLVWVCETFTVSNGGVRFFIDASNGDVIRQGDTTETQLPSTAYVGHGKGVLGDDKKISTSPLSGGFITFDTIRPPNISTYDLRANLTRTAQVLGGVLLPAVSDYATTGSNNDWADQAVVDAHVNSSYTYDYYYKRFNRRGLDNADIKMTNVVHAVRRSDVFVAGSLLGVYWVNAGYYPQANAMYYGEGLPPGVTLGGKYYDYFSGALDIVAHELTHGVTNFTSDLEYRNESGALNEAFSDMMGTSVEFFIQPPGNGPLKADYLLGEDISRAVAPGTLNGDRSLENPALFGQPDHYSKRFAYCTSVCSASLNDNGNVHTNSGIANNAFYLAIEGGTNRTSGVSVQGVGASSRVQIERVFYRAFAQLMPRNGTFAMARVITLQAATDLYGANSPAYRAVRDAWTAVGVN